MKKTIKKVLLGSLALAAAASLAACGPQKKAGKNTAITVDSNLFTGDFFTGEFSNSSYDTQVIFLTNNTATLDLTPEGKFVVNEGVVEKDGFTRAKDAEGNTVATLKLRKDLKWSDGKPVTAYDYAFSVLFSGSKEWGEAGAAAYIDPAYLGGEDYLSGKSKNLPAIKVLDDYTFTVTVKKEFTPYFYETNYFSVGALPLHELGLGGKVVSSENGVSFDGDMKKVAENAKKTQVDSKKPTVTYGKYLIDKSAETEVVLKLNPNYVGNYEGVKPTVETITIKANKNLELDVDRLIAGEVDLVLGVIESKKLEKVAKDENIGKNKYERNGYGYLGMANEFGPTADVNVRRAIGHLTNRSGLISAYLGGNGVALSGEYTNAQWMKNAKEAELAKLNNYAYDVNLANEELDKSTYKFEKDGVTPFDKSKASENYLRHNNKGEALVVNHLGTDNNTITELLATNFKTDAPKVGMKYVLDKSDWPTLVKNMSITAANSKEQKYHLYNLATSYTGSVFDPFLNSFHSRNAGDPTRNQYRVKDKQLDDAAEKLRLVKEGDTETYANHWLTYQQRFNEILPVLPLYANIYTDLFNAKKIQHLESGSMRNWAQRIEYTRLK